MTNETLQQWLWRSAAEHSPTNPSAALQQALIKAGYSPYSPEFWAEFEGVKYAIQPGIYWSGEHRALAYCKVPEWNRVQIITGPGEPAPEPNGNPLDGLRLGHLFKYRYARTDVFNSPRDYTGGKHEGADYDLVGGLANNTAAVLCVYEGVVDGSKDSTGGYGKYIRVKHQRNGRDFYTWYGHLDRRYVEVGRPVKMGDELGEVGTTGRVTGEHVHLTLSVPGYGLSGYIIADVVDPEPFMASGRNTLPLINAEQNTVDLLPYFLGDGRMYEVRHPTGQTETFQTQTQGNDFWLVKNSQYEALRYDQGYIWRGLDTSPGPAPDDAERPGVLRYYRQFEPGLNMARWCKRFMAVGETWTGPGHHVRFFYKDDCRPSAANSGSATNKVTLVAHYPAKAWGDIVVNDVVELRTNTGESMYFGRGYGLVGWKAAWGESAIVERLDGRPALQREIIGCL